MTIVDESTGSWRPPWSSLRMPRCALQSSLPSGASGRPPGAGGCAAAGASGREPRAGRLRQPDRHGAVTRMADRAVPACRGRRLRGSCAVGGGSRRPEQRAAGAVPGQHLRRGRPAGQRGAVRAPADGGATAVQQLHYGLLAMGDRAYANFRGFGMALEQWLARQGAKPMFERVDVDDGDEAALRDWQHRLGRIAGTATCPTGRRPTSRMAARCRAGT